MESYRCLGSYIIDKMSRGRGDDAPAQHTQAFRQLDIDEFVCLVGQYLESTRRRPVVTEPEAPEPPVASPLAAGQSSDSR
jgi:hypothetical protein